MNETAETTKITAETADGHPEAAEAAASAGLLKKIVGGRFFFPLVCLGLVLAMEIIVKAVKGEPIGGFFSITLKNGALYGPIMDIFQLSAERIILAVGMTLVISCSAGVDISVGAVMALSSAVGVWLLGYGTIAQNHYHVVAYVVPYLVGLLAALAVGALCGLWNGFLVSKLKIQPMVATLILFIAARGAAKVVAQGQKNVVDVPSFRWLGTNIQVGSFTFPVPTPILVAAAVVIVTVLVLRFTALGMNIQAVGINNRASRIVGLKSSRIILMAFLFIGVCAGIAGFITTSRIATVDFQNTGNLIELDAILAVALGGNSLAGGKFSIGGSVIGALTIQTLTIVLYAINVTPNSLLLYKAIVVIIIVTLQSTELKPMLGRAIDSLRRLFGSAPVPQRNVIEVSES